MSRAMLRSSQLLALVLVAFGIFGLYHEPLPASDALIKLHLIHYGTQVGLIVVGLLLFDPRRLAAGVSGVIVPILDRANPWKAKS